MRDRIRRVSQALIDAVLWAPNESGLINLPRLRESVNYQTAHSGDGGLEPEETQREIRGLIDSPSPSLVGRFGSTELRLVLRDHNRRNRSAAQKAYALLTRLEAPVWVPWEEAAIRKKSGFYPVTRESTREFSKLMLHSAKKVDLLGSWVPGENHLRDYFPTASITTLSSLSPFGFENPWTSSLRNKKVLVIHPFADTIQQQFVKREMLHRNALVLPECDLLTLRAVQSLGTPPAQFATWFDGLESMVVKARAIEFDVAIIGCGAYGFPLGALLKSLGKKAIVLGGLVQLLFGIKGKRWDNSGLYNEHWTRPLECEKPDGYRGADGGAYW